MQLFPSEAAVLFSQQTSSTVTLFQPRAELLCGQQCATVELSLSLWARVHASVGVSACVRAGTSLLTDRLGLQSAEAAAPLSPFR